MKFSKKKLGIVIGSLVAIGGVKLIAIDKFELPIYFSFPKVEVKGSNLDNSPIIVDSSIYVVPKKPARHLTDDIKNKLSQILPSDRNKKIFLRLPMGYDKELDDFANDIKLFLGEVGYNAKKQTGSFIPFEGDIRVENRNDSFELFINMNN